MLRRIVAGLLGALLLLAAAQARAADTIVLWHAYRGKELEALQQVLKAYSTANIELLAVPHDAFATKLSAAIPLARGRTCSSTHTSGWVTFVPAVWWCR